MSGRAVKALAAAVDDENLNEFAGLMRDGSAFFDDLQSER